MKAALASERTAQRTVWPARRAWRRTQKPIWPVAPVMSRSSSGKMHSMVAVVVCWYISGWVFRWLGSLRRRELVEDVR